MIPEANFNSQLENPKLPKSSSKRFLARIWPKTAVSQGFQKALSIASWKAPNYQHLLPKGSWPGFGSKWPFPNDSRKDSIAGPGSSKMPNFRSKRLLATIWPKAAVSPGFQKALPIAGRKAPNCPNLFPKGSWLGFGPKPAVSQSSFNSPAQTWLYALSTEAKTCSVRRLWRAQPTRTRRVAPRPAADI